MPRKKTPSGADEPIPMPSLTVSRDEATRRIQEQVDKGIALIPGNNQNSVRYDELFNAYNNWDRFNVALLRKLFNTPEISEEYDRWLIAGSYETPADVVQEINDHINKLKSILDRMSLFDEPVIPAPDSAPRAATPTTLERAIPASPPNPFDKLIAMGENLLETVKGTRGSNYAVAKMGELPKRNVGLSADWTLAEKWKTASLSALARHFKDTSDLYKNFKALEKHIPERIYITKGIGILHAAKDEYDEHPPTTSVEERKEKMAASISEKTKVFVVHGHDEAAKQSVARFLERLELEAVILHEQASGGKTIIEKFESYSDVRYAVVLLTPDDIGYAKSTPENLESRARQNVIFELGYFIGKLGRSKVCALYKSGVTIPSDYQGVVFIEMDSAEGWHNKLAKEIKASGIVFDSGKLI